MRQGHHAQPTSRRATDADVRHRAALAAAIKRDRYARFEAYYAERELQRIAA